MPGTDIPVPLDVRVNQLEQSDEIQNGRLATLEQNHQSLDQTISLHQKVIDQILEKQREISIKQDATNTTLDRVSDKVTEFSTKQDIAFVDMKETNMFLRQLAQGKDEAMVTLLTGREETAREREQTKRELSVTRRIVGSEAFKWLVALSSSTVLLGLIQYFMK